MEMSFSRANGGLVMRIFFLLGGVKGRLLKCVEAGIMFRSLYLHQQPNFQSFHQFNSSQCKTIFPPIHFSPTTPTISHFYSYSSIDFLTESAFPLPTVFDSCPFLCVRPSLLECGRLNPVLSVRAKRHLLFAGCCYDFIFKTQHFPAS